MNNQEIAKLLRKVAAVYTLKSENRFKIIAYENAADSIENSVIEAQDLWKDKKLSKIPGVGKSIAAHLEELFKTGSVKHFESVFKGLPSALFTLLDVPGFGAKRAYKLAKELSLKDPRTATSDLLEAARMGKVASIAGFGEKSQEEIIEALGRLKKGQVKENRMSLPYAFALAQEVLNYLRRHKDTKDAVPLGSLRRQTATIGDIDIAVATDNPSGLIDWFVAFPKKIKLVEKGPGGASILLSNGRQVDLRVQSPGSFGSMLQYFTGNKNHNIKLREMALKKGLSLSEYGIKPISSKGRSAVGRKSQNYNSKLKLYEYATEKEFYDALGLPWMPPEIREDSGEIEAALREVQGVSPGLPKLVELGDIKGDIHIHSNYDLEPSHDLGTSEPLDIINMAKKLRYEYIGLSDHNPSQTNHNSQQIIDILKRRKAKYEQIIYSTKSVRVNLFITLEVDILPDGKLPLPSEAFSFLDGVIVSIHSSFGMSKDEMTKRIISGISHPKARILGHPTGRLIGGRSGYEADWDKIFRFCKDKDKALEINAYPNRLDLPDGLVREAVKQNVKLVINTDSHNASQMELMRYGVSVARRGWSQKNDILNTMSYNKFKDWLTIK